MIPTGDSHHDSAKQWLTLSGTAMAEEITGRSLYDPGVAGVALPLMRAISDNRRAVLSELGDTYWEMPWKGFRETVKDSDFKVVAETSISDRLVNERRHLIAGDVGRRLLLVAGSNRLFGTAILNNAEIYGTLDGGQTEESQHHTFMSLLGVEASLGAVGDTHFRFSIDGREGLLTRLRQLDEAGVTYSDWVRGSEPSADLTLPIGGYTPEWRTEEIDTFLALPDWVKKFMNRDIQDLWFNNPPKRH